MVFDSNCGRTRRLIVLAVCALVIAVALLASPLALTRANAAPVSAAPVSAAWNEYLEASSQGRIASHTIDGYPLGAIPSPRDPALTRGLRVSTGLVGALPTSFDLRTTGKLTPVRNQGSFGTCWSFASYGSLESCLLPGETSQLLRGQPRAQERVRLEQRDRGDPLQHGRQLPDVDGLSGPLGRSRRRD